MSAGGDYFYVDLWGGDTAIRDVGKPFHFTSVIRDDRVGKQQVNITDNANAFTIPNKDFNLRSFRSTLVLSWEWRPGSTLFLVWQQARSRELASGTRATLNDLLRSAGAAGDNLFAVKMSYWIGV